MHPTTEHIRKILLSVTEGMQPQDWTRRPAGKWTAAEVLEHLSLTYSGTARSMQNVLQKGAPTATPLNLKQRLGIWYVTSLGRFPEGRQAPLQVVPKGGTDGTGVLDETLDHLVKMDDAIAQCEHRFGPVRISNHPVLGALTAEQWRKFHSAHARHHALQIERLRSKA